MESYAQLSEEQLEGIHFLLLKSPPCELHILLSEIKDLLAGVEIPSSFLESTIKEYNLEHNVLVPVPDEERPIVLHGLMDDENIYQSSLSGKSYSYDHVTNQIIEEVEGSQPYCEKQTESIYTDVLSSGKKYIARRFHKNSGFFVGVDGNHIDLIITAELNKLDSFYSGRWVSRYLIDCMESNICVKGSVDISTHYFENGNIRMELHRDMKKVELSKSALGYGNELFTCIGQFEDGVQEGLNDAFASLQQDTLKSFRRQLPRTHRHFVWQVNAHKLADTLKQTQKQ